MIRKVVSIFAKEGGYFGRHFGILEWINSVYASATDFSISWCCWRYGSCQNIRSFCSLDCILLFVCLSCVVLFGLMAWPQRLNKHDYYLWLTSETYNQYENGFCTDLSQRPTSCTLHCICAACATSRERQSTPTVWRQMTTERHTCNSSPSTSWLSYIVAKLHRGRAVAVVADDSNQRGARMSCRRQLRLWSLVSVQHRSDNSHFQH